MILKSTRNTFNKKMYFARKHRYAVRAGFKHAGVFSPVILALLVLGVSAYTGAVGSTNVVHQRLQDTAFDEQDGSITRD